MSAAEEPEVVADEPLDPFADPAAPAASTARPQPETTAETADQRARRCRFYKHCTCDHTVCRDGWLDDDVPNPTSINPHNVANARCRFCADAQEMAGELSAMRGRGR